MTRRARSAKSRRPRAEGTTAAERTPAVPLSIAAAPGVAPRRWRFPLAVAVVTVAAFWPVLGHQFLDWDDDVTLVANPAFRGLGWANLRWMLTATLMGHWVPATWITFGVDYLVWGMDRAAIT